MVENSNNFFKQQFLMYPNYVCEKLGSWIVQIIGLFVKLYKKFGVLYEFVRIMSRYDAKMMKNSNNYF
jgi:hypothetical protein